MSPWERENRGIRIPRAPEPLDPIPRNAAEKVARRGRPDLFSVVRKRAAGWPRKRLIKNLIERQVSMAKSARYTDKLGTPSYSQRGRTTYNSLCYPTVPSTQPVWVREHLYTLRRGKPTSWKGWKGPSGGRESGPGFLDDHMIYLATCGESIEPIGNVGRCPEFSS